MKIKFNDMTKFGILFFILSFACCQNSTENKKINLEDLKEPLVGANKILVQKESEDIENYIKRHGWDMETSGTGLRIFIYKNGKGTQAETGDVVRINYNVKLINGIEVYSSKEDGPLDFLTGAAEVINGLEEAILRMRQGDRAKIIVPSHLAYGLLGDDEKIPKRATLIYDIELVSVVKFSSRPD